MSSSHCLNCFATLEPKQKFCSQCGQKTSIHRLSLHEIGHDALHYFTHADKGIFSLLKDLFTKPGQVAREYAAGRRVRYFKPLNFYLIVMGILVFMTSAFYTEDLSGSRPLEQRAAYAKTIQEKAYFTAMAGRVKKVNKFIGKYSNAINMMTVPLFTLIFWLFYLRDRYNYTEHLVANIYFVGFIMLFYALIITPLNYLIKNPRLDMVLIGIFFLFEISYRASAYYAFVHKRGWLYALKALGVSLLCTALWAWGTYSLISWYIRKG
jgi:hypothetical protein